jgi:hypothetical protein
LSQMHDWPGLLGFARLENEVAEELSHVIGSTEAAPAAVEGLTPRRIAATLIALVLRGRLVEGDVIAEVALSAQPKAKHGSDAANGN